MSNDNDTRPLNAYEQKQEARRAHYEARAGKAEGQSAAAHRDADRLLSVIPPGQPILIGHHSEKGHRRHLARVDGRMRAAVESQKTAEYYASKAASVGRGGISSDDPDAADKIREKLAALEHKQDVMKKVNRVVRKHTRKNQAVPPAELVALGLSEKAAALILTPDFTGEVGYPSYALQNNNANIRRYRERLAEAENAAERDDVETEGDGYTFRLDVAENRVMFIFPGKPDEETRTLLKRNGFKWSRSRTAWVRKWTGNGEYAGRAVKQALDADA